MQPSIMRRNYVEALQATQPFFASVGHGHQVEAINQYIQNLTVMPDDLIVKGRPLIEANIMALLAAVPVQGHA